MFVDITNPKSPLAVENILAPYKKGRVIRGVRQPKEKITPDVCLEILKSTNYARNIKDMLLCIAELPTSEQAQFKEVIIATFYKREQPQSVVTLGCQLADAHGFILPQSQDEEHPTYLSSAPERILMVGNSVKSDIVPVINIGGFAIHLPHEVTWIHEMMDLPESKRVSEAKNIREIPILVDKIQTLAQELQVETSE